LFKATVGQNLSSHWANPDVVKTSAKVKPEFGTIFTKKFKPGAGGFQG
jgi:hypothetical protein